MTSHWDELLSDLLRQISNRLNFVDRVRFSLVCKHWQRSITLDCPVDPTPWLWIPPQNDEPDDIKRENQIYNPADGHLHRTGLFSEENGESSFCVGASHGHLIFFHYCIPTHCTGSPCFTASIFNPLTGARTPLPEICRDFRPMFSDRRTIGFTTREIREHVVHKAILTSDPTDDRGGRFAAVLLDDGGRGISFCAPSSYFSWSELEGAASYHDVYAVNGLLFALAGDYSVEVWNLWWEDFDYAVKVTTFSPSVPKRFAFRDLEYEEYKFYVVTDGDDNVVPVLVARIVGDFIDDDGNVIEDPKKMDEEAVWPYRTVGFEVYKMDGERRNWVRTMSLSEGEEERALFLGGSHSVSVVASGEVAADCIYFTDDSWDLMNEYEYSYGGHDFGVFDLRSGKVRRFDCGLERDRFDPPPSWLVPSLRNYSM